MTPRTARTLIAIAAFTGISTAVLAANVARVAQSSAAFSKIAGWGPAAAGKIRQQLLGVQLGQNAFDAAAARQALLAQPLASEPFAVIAAARMSEDSPNGKARIDTLLTEALRRDPRSRAARLLLMRHAALSGDLAGAFAQLDVLNRLSPGLVAQAMQAIALQINSPQRMDTALRALAGHASLYQPFINGLVGKNKSRDVIVRLAGGLPPAVLADPVIRNSVAAMLVDVQEFRLSRSIWQHGAPAAGSGLVYSADFADRRTPGPFNWQLLESTFGAAQFAPDRGLSVVFYDRSPGRFARQIVTLTPGRYRLSVEFRVLSGTADNIRVQLGCVGAGQPIAEIALQAKGSNPAKLQADFAVPAQACGGQELVVAGVISSKRSETETEVRRIDIVPLERGA